MRNRRAGLSVCGDVLPPEGPFGAVNMLMKRSHNYNLTFVDYFLPFW